jgi:hypothetical protein
MNKRPKESIPHSAISSEKCFAPAEKPEKYPKENRDDTLHSERKPHEY